MTAASVSLQFLGLFGGTNRRELAFGSDWRKLQDGEGM